MNRMKFNSYGLINPSANEIPAIADYIIENYIINLPRRLNKNVDLYLNLLEKRYHLLNYIYFDDSIFEKISKMDDDEVYNRLASFMAKHNIPIASMPEPIRNNHKMLNIIMKVISNGANMVISYTKDKKELYDALDKAEVARQLVKYADPYTSLDNPFLEHDEALFKMIVNDPNLKNNTILAWFEHEMYKTLDIPTLYHLISRGIVQVEWLPDEIIHNPEMVKYVISDNEHPYSWMFNLFTAMIYGASDEILEMFYQALCQTNINIGKSAYNMLDMSKLADYIIDHNFANIMNSLIRYDYNIFKKLVEKEYPGVLRTEFLSDFFTMHHDVIYKLFKENILDDETKYNQVISRGAYAAICQHYEILSDDNIAKIAKYIVHTKRYDVVGFLANSERLFKTFLEMDIDNLFQYAFREDAYANIPIETLQAYYKKHPQSLSHCKPSIAMAISNIAQDIDYHVIRPTILAQSRIASAYALVQYNGLAQKLCESIRKIGAHTTYLNYRHMLEEMGDELNISYIDIQKLLIGYENNPGEYEDKINELARRFYATKKERISQEETDRVMDNVRENHTRIDNREQIKYAKKQKRKILYYQYLMEHIKTHTLSSEELKILELINSLDKTLVGDGDIIAKLINGTTILRATPAYLKNEKLRKYRRIKANYEVLLNRIYQANPEYQDLILGYIKGETKHEDLRKVLEQKHMTTLHDLKTLLNDLDVTIKLQDGRIIFSGEYNLTPEESVATKSYDEVQNIINKINKLINANMNRAFPLDKITVSEAEITSAIAKGIEPKYIIDYSKIERVEDILRIFEASEDLPTEEAKAIYQRLFVDSGYIYALPFVEGIYRKNAELLFKNVPHLKILFDDREITFENFEKIVKTLEMYRYATPVEYAILGQEIAYKIANKESFILERSEEDKRGRVALAAKYSALASKNTMSSVPFVTAEVNGIKIEKYMPNDPSILVSGIDTDACFRILGTDNDFILYTLFNKNGFVLRITDETGKFIGRVSGFRNGNTLYLNQARTYLDTHGNPNKESNELFMKIRATVEAWAKEVVETTANTEEPIDYVLIHKAYGYGDCDTLPLVDHHHLHSRYPMNVDAPDFKDFKNNPELLLKEAENGFTTDYYGHQDILLLASKEGKQLTKSEDIIDYDSCVLYDRPRQTPKVYQQAAIDETVIAKINSLNARDIYWGNTKMREVKHQNFKLVTRLDDIVAAVIGEDFYIMIDKDGKLTELCLQYDKRAESEFKEYHTVVMETYLTSQNKTR